MQHIFIFQVGDRLSTYIPHRLPNNHTENKGSNDQRFPVLTFSGILNIQMEGVMVHCKKTEKIVIEKASLRDLPSILQLQDKQAIETRRFMNNLDKKGEVIFYSRSEIEKIIRSSKSYAMLAKVGDKTVGCGFVTIEKASHWSKYKKQGYLGGLFVDKKYRRQGIAWALQEAGIKWLKSKGIKL